MATFGKLVQISSTGEEQALLLSKETITFGRDAANDIQLADARASRQHARLDCSESGCVLVDLNSANGTLLFSESSSVGQPVLQANLAPGDVFQIGGTHFRYEAYLPHDENLLAQINSLSELEQTIASETVGMTIVETNQPRIVIHTPEKTWEIRLSQALTTIGRGDENPICIPHAKVSRVHAQVERSSTSGGTGDSFILRDLNSRNGTWLGSQSISEHTLHPGDAIRIGPATLTFKAAFTPADLTLVEDALTVRADTYQKPPVIFVPGLMGSQLWAGSELVWPNIRMLFSNPEILTFPSKTPLEPRGIVNEVVIVPNLIKQEQYKRMGDYLEEGLGYKRGVDLLEFAYDWRQDVRESAKKLAQTIEAWDVTGPIVLIAHSLGTLVSRYYLECLGGKSKVAQTILMGGPHYGVPRAVANLVTKADLLPFGLLGDRFREVLATFPSMYQILPIYNSVFDQNGLPISVFEDEAWLPAQQAPLLRLARAFRHELGRRVSVPAVSVFGYGLPTISRVNVVRDAQGGWSKVDLITEKSGDASIPDASTILEGSDIHPVEQYHGSLFVDNDVRMRLKLELTGQRRRA